MKDISKIFLSIPKLIFLYINKFYNRLRFLFNKQRTIQEMFKPIINKKLDINKKLLSELKQIRKENTQIESKIHFLDRKNKSIENKISILQELLIKRP